MTIKDLYATAASNSHSGEASKTGRAGVNDPSPEPRKPCISYELYPPRNPRLTSQAWAGIDKLLDSRPDYVSVTFGTSGTNASSSQSVLLHSLKRSGRPALAHLTCWGRGREALTGIIIDMMEVGVRDFLALRGDVPSGSRQHNRQPHEMERAVQLVALIREVAAGYLGDPNQVSIAVAAYPAGTQQDRRDAVAALMEKQAAGADFAITQVFYDAADYIELVESAARKGANLPIVPGVIPFTDIGRLRRLESLTGVPVPQRLQDIAAIADPAERILESVGATLDFVDDLMSAGAPGIHFYTFNRPRPVLDLVAHLRSRGFGPVDKQDSTNMLEMMMANMRRISPQ